jgi:hypothetical protein
MSAGLSAVEPRTKVAVRMVSASVDLIQMHGSAIAVPPAVE